MLRWFVCAIVIGGIVRGGFAADSILTQGPADAEITITLSQALRRPSLLPPGEQRHDLVIRVSRLSGRLIPDCYAFSPGYNTALISGELGIPTDGSADLLVKLELPRTGGSNWGDLPGPEGVAVYQIRLADKSHPGHFSATFRQTLRGDLLPGGWEYDINGECSAVSGSAWPARIAARAMPRPGEHPRLLFRGDQIATLRKRASTPIGQAFMAKAAGLMALSPKSFTLARNGAADAPGTEGAHAAGRAFAWLINADPADLEMAKWMTLRAMSVTTGEWGAWHNAWRLAGVALAYDLLHDEWNKTDPQFVARVNRWLEAAAAGRGNSTDLHFDAMFRSAAGLAALAIVNDPSPTDTAPPAPDAAPLIAAPKNFSAPEGLDSSAILENNVATKWLVAGGWPVGYGGEPLSSIGGAGAARPTPGMGFKQGDIDFSFQNRNSEPGRLADLSFPITPMAAGPKYAGVPQVAMYYAVLDVNHPRAVKVSLDTPGSLYGPELPVQGAWRMWINGTEVRDGQVVRLEVGNYPIMLELLLSGQTIIYPQLIEYTDSLSQRDQDQFHARQAAGEKAGAVDSVPARLARQSAQFIRRHFELSWGDRGFTTEDSNLADALTVLMPYLQALAVADGIDLPAALPRSRWIIPLMDLTDLRFLHHDYAPEHLRLLGLPELTPKPSLASQRRAIDAAMKRSEPVIALPWDAMLGMVSYPFDTAAAAPAPLPAVLKDDPAGGIVLSNPPAAPRPIQTIVTLRTSAPRSSVTAGDVSILLEGKLLTGAAISPGGIFRPATLAVMNVPNVLRISNALPTRGAKLTHFESRDDGSASMTFVQDSWVNGQSDHPLQSPRYEHPRQLGFSATRMVLVDYSGRCGSPGLVVIADRADTTPNRPAWLQWRFQDPTGDRPKMTLKEAGWTVYDQAAPTARTAPPVPSRPPTTAPRSPSSTSAPATRPVPKPMADPRWTLRGSTVYPKNVKVERRGGILEIALNDQVPTQISSPDYRRQLARMDRVGERARTGRADPMEAILFHPQGPGPAPEPAAPGALKPTWFVTVLTIQQGEKAPAITAEGTVPNLVLRIGEQRVRLTETQLLWDPNP